MNRAALLGMVGLAVLLPVRAQAQTLGIKAGVTVNRIAFSEEIGPRDATDSAAGFIGGVSFTQPVNDMFGVQIEGLIAQKRTKEQFRFGDRLTLTYLEVPILARVDLPGSGRARVHLFSGPAFAFNLAAKYQDEGDTMDVADDIENTEVGWTAGGGIDLGRVTVDARYTWGLTGVVTDSDVPDVKLRNRTLAVMVGVSFGRR